MDALSSGVALAPWRRAHRLLSWLAAVAIGSFALTGLLHPVMTRVQPVPAQRQPPTSPQDAGQLPAPKTVLAAAGIEVLHALRPVFDGRRWWWRAQTPEGSVHYVDALGQKPSATDAEARHAERLARWYTGVVDQPVVAIALVSDFSDAYPEINRLLPVWRVQFAGEQALAAYVSTADDRLATLNNRHKQRYQQLFRSLHNWSWLPLPARMVWIHTLLLSLAATALLGLALALRSPGPRRWNARRFHRWGGCAVLLAALTWVLSGLVQAYSNVAAVKLPGPTPMPVAASRLIAPLSLLPAAQASLVSVAGEPCWRWTLSPPSTPTGQGHAMAEHQEHGQLPASGGTLSSRYFSAVDGHERGDAERIHLAELLVRYQVPGDAARATPVAAFTEEYGFQFKRLPVWRVEAADDARTAYFLDPAGERLSAQVDETDRLAGALFAYVHKWEWVTPWAGKNGRDALTTIWALALLMVAILGTRLRRRAPK